MSDANERPQDAGDLPVTPRQLLLATIGHVLVGALLVFGVQCSPKPPEEIIIQAVLLEEPVVGEKPVTVVEAVKPKPPEPKPPEPKPALRKPARISRSILSAISRPRTASPRSAGCWKQKSSNWKVPYLMLKYPWYHD